MGTWFRLQFSLSARKKVSSLGKSAGGKCPKKRLGRGICPKHQLDLHFGQGNCPARCPVFLAEPVGEARGEKGQRGPVWGRSIF
jgi:hypothetical protein